MSKLMRGLASRVSLSLGGDEAKGLGNVEDADGRAEISVAVSGSPDVTTPTPSPGHAGVELGEASFEYADQVTPEHAGKGHHRSISQQSIDRFSMQRSTDDDISGDETDSSGDAGGPDDLSYLPSKEGYMLKWTNYFHGWQSRYLVLTEGTLSYFKTREEDSYARAKIDVTGAMIIPHAVDPLRFDVSVGGESFFFRGNSLAEKETWMLALKDSQKNAAGEPLKRVGSMNSLASLSSNQSGSSSGIARAKEKLADVQTFHAMASQNLESLLGMLGVGRILGAGSSYSNNDGGSGIVPVSGKRGHSRSISDGGNADLRREMLAFKSTATSALSAMEDYATLMQAREDRWQSRIKRYKNKVKSLEVQYTAAMQRVKLAEKNPDFVEGPNSLLTEEQWFDAIDEAHELDSAIVPDVSDDDDDSLVKPSAEPVKHKWFEELQEMMAAFTHMVDSRAENDWVVNSDNGRGLVCYKAFAEIHGKKVEKIAVEHKCPYVNAEELCRYFADPKYRKVWEPMDACKKIESLDADTMLIWALCKRMWPSAQRDLLTVLHVEQLPDTHGTGRDRWIVVVRSVQDDRIPANQNGLVRIDCKAHLLAETVYGDAYDPANPQRKHVSCRFSYCADINPGGWAPQAIVATVAKTELPKGMDALAKAVKSHFKPAPYIQGRSHLVW